MKLYSYVVCSDTGFAPNPFWGYCTLAACTPNHIGICPEIGDWIIGTESIANGSKLVYAMQIAHKLAFDKYYSDQRFRNKIPVKNSADWRKQCGDNIYYKNKSGKWQQHPTKFHYDRENKRQDLKHPYVFIAKRFYYFGGKAKNIPSKYNSLVWKRQGVKCRHLPKVVGDFLVWLQNNFKQGIHGNPRDCKSKSDKCSASESMHWRKCAP